MGWSGQDAKGYRPPAGPTSTGISPGLADGYAGIGTGASIRFDQSGTTGRMVIDPYGQPAGKPFPDPAKKPALDHESQVGWYATVSHRMHELDWVYGRQIGGVALQRAVDKSGRTWIIKAHYTSARPAFIPPPSHACAFCRRMRWEKELKWDRVDCRRGRLGWPIPVMVWGCLECWTDDNVKSWRDAFRGGLSKAAPAPSDRGLSLAEKGR